MRYLLPLLLAICSNAFGQSEYVQSDLIDGPKAVAVGELFKVKIKGDLPYKVDPEPVSIDELLDRKGNLLLLIVSSESGDLKITVDYRVVHPTDEEIEKAPWDDRAAFAKWLKESSQDELYSDSHTVKVGKGPEPGPDPDPEPDPDVKPPIPEPGFRVFIFYEKDDTLPPLQQAILAGEEVATYLNKTCIEEPGGGAGYRIYDKDADLSNELPVWQKAFQRRPESVPWVIISNGVTGTEEPLPASPSAFIELCRKYEAK